MAAVQSRVSCVNISISLYRDSEGCVGVKIDVDCASDVRRVKRETGHSLRVRIELPVKREMAVDASSGERLHVADAIQNEILTRGGFNLEKVLPNGRPDLATFKILDQFFCQPGQVVVDDQCGPFFLFIENNMFSALFAWFIPLVCHLKM